ncbi:FAD-dependent oxidoreductase [Brachybacterium nesterenkovii]|uniref:FAD-dependent oxidoreductase n=1 Tax=Brachybacterium nesterenkovii TaxID=47847 RepID=UPI00321AA6AD
MSSSRTAASPRRLAPGARPGRDRRAVLHRAAPGADGAAGRRVIVIGGGIAGLSAASALADRGVAVTLLEQEATWGGRARSWDLPGGRSMSRGFHAFFRQYYTLRALLRRTDPHLEVLRSIGDYPLQLAGGPRDSFRGIPRTPPLSVAAFALRSQSFPLRELARVDVRAAAGLLRTDFPATFAAHDGRSAQDLLNALRFPPQARHLALEVFARSFFADPRDFSAGELVGMFHTYFMGSAEGLIFDVPREAYSPALWDPIAQDLERRGAAVRARSHVTTIARDGDGVIVRMTPADDPAGAESELRADALVLATDPRTSRTLLGGMEPAAPRAAWDPWLADVSQERNAPPFAVLRRWLDRPAAPSAPAFLGTSGFGPLDNVSLLERFEGTAERWARAHGGCVVELHAYALPWDAPDAAEDVQAALRAELGRQLEQVRPELRGARTLHEEWLVRDDCPLIGTGPWARRPTVRTPDPHLVLAGDWLRTDEPVALMERAALTGVHAANALLNGWGAQGHDWWSVPLRGVLARGGARRG